MNYRDSQVIEAMNRHRRQARTVLACAVAFIFLVLAFVWGSANATDAVLEWGAPTQYVDGTSIPAGTVIKYDIYLDGKFFNTTTQTSFFAAGYTSAVGCFTLRAIIAGVSSDPSISKCKPTPAPQKKAKPPELKSAT